MNWFFKVLEQYADFDGRARRKEYWMFSLFYLIFLLVAFLLDNLSGLLLVKDPYSDFGYGIFYILYGLFMFIPAWAVFVRRLHDIGKSGWWILIGLIPIIGGIWLFVLTVTNSEPGENKYGANPKENIIITRKKNDGFHNFIMSLLLSAFIACGIYAFLTVTKIINHETAKVIIFITSFVACCVYSLCSKKLNK